MNISVQDAKDIMTTLKEQEFALIEQAPFDKREGLRQIVQSNLRHVYGAAYIARMIALKIPGMNAEDVYISTLLHDVGRMEETRVHRFHGIIGYEKLKNIDQKAARIALIHMFPYNILPAFEESTDLFWNNRQDYNNVANYLKHTQVTEEDMLVQLADSLANKDGFVTLDTRFEEYQKRHQVTLPKEQITSRYQLKDYFDKKLGIDIYTLFPAPTKSIAHFEKNIGLAFDNSYQHQ